MNCIYVVMKTLDFNGETGNYNYFHYTITSLGVKIIDIMLTIASFLITDITTQKIELI